ncbi:MAG: Glutamyl-tRNA(Gln) amidotransferase subunit A [Candidatus Moranbacteria bacterium GW2011_GWF2_34_56]|nr:MAG: Glutamyl-tRNA(Gln) amidotransferase subunit A [Candidatus Moranbacteria bacterium GW2011_GWF1_34_10]KKP63827.1 MAG: Glutamyl-tRNA(Gln) amidotransferase subunit A [Candidatus Moranbacteria bacterium GW2011_GWF2_34_56]HBI17465.1 Asp-tRNA(Asn)/Glu-tRNA(Gln) amidotransferase GatCAB subunit A [Candidatus Moranbacteria bacterium]
MIRELHEKLKNGEINSVDLTKKYFDEIELKDKNILAYLTLHKELALNAAQEIDKKIQVGEDFDLLGGIPMALKDNMCVMGGRTTAASKILDNYIAPYDATVVKKLREKGAIILGKTNMDEFAMGSSTENSAYQKTRNPHDLNRVPGGSSGGSAAAVVSDMAVYALGSDTGGSVRQPASFCGAVGLKPTYGRVSRHGLLAMASSFDQIGPIAKSVEDAAIVLSRIAGRDLKDATSAKSGGKFYEDYLTGNIKGMKIGVPKEYFGDGLSDEIKNISFAALEKFKKLGAELVEINIPHNEYALPIYYITVPSEVSSNMARFDGIRYGLSIDDQEKSKIGAGKLLETYLDTREIGFGPEVKRRIMLGTYALSAGYYDAYYKKAQKVRRLLRQDFEKAFEKVDLIFSPTAPEPAFKIGEKTTDLLQMYLSDIYTVTANLVGVPAISFPIGEVERESKKLPIGGQLMGRWFGEEELLNAAHTFELN